MKIKKDYVMREVAGQAIVIAVGEESKKFRGMMNLNKTGKDIWEGINRGMTQEEIVETLLEKYEIDHATAEKDVKNIIQKMYAARDMEK